MDVIRRQRTNLKLFGSILIFILYLFPFTHPAIVSAHAYIIKSSPYENQKLTKAPTQVTIQFDETIQSSFQSMKVYDSKGNRVDRNDGQRDEKNPAIIKAGLKQNLPAGTYSIQWRVVSSDGHPVKGVIDFQVGKNAGKQKTSSESEKEKGYTPHLDLVILRWLQYMSNACFTGILFFFLTVLHKEIALNAAIRKSLNRIVIISFTILSCCIILNLPLQGTIESDVPWSQILNIDKLKDIITQTNFGRNWIIQLDLLFILLIAMYFFRKKPFSKTWLSWFVLLIGIGLLLLKSFTSHAAAGNRVFYSITVDFFHLLSASIWIGSLTALAVLIPLIKSKDYRAPYLESVRRFSKWGMALVLVLVVTGILGSLSYIPNIRTLYTTGYGRVLSGKIVLLLVMIILAAINFMRGKCSKDKGLSSSIWGELVTGMVVLVLSVFLTNMPTAMVSPGPIKETNTIKDGSTITFRATPNIMGLNNFMISISDRNGKPIRSIEQVTLTFTSLEMDMRNETKTLIKRKDGEYQAKGMNFNMAGRWKVHVHVLTKELSSLDTDFNVIVGSQ